MDSTRPAIAMSRAAAVRHCAAAAAAVTAAVLQLAPWAPLRASADATFDAALFSLVNADRAAHGVAPLHWNGALGAIAESAPYGGCGFTVDGRAEDMIRRNYFAHAILGCGGRTVFAVLGADGIGYAAAGENIGWLSGISDPVAAAQWLNSRFMASAEHVANILDPAYTAVGTGSWWTAPGQVWTGAGTPETGVVMAAEEFIAAPASPARARPAPAPPPRPHAVAAAAVSAAAPATAPPTAVQPVTPDAADAVESDRCTSPVRCVSPPVAVSSRVRPVAARVPDSRPAAIAPELALLAFLAALSVVRRRRRRPLDIF